jgi:flagellar protein FliS
MKAPGANAYLRTKVMTASPAELRLMLFDGAIRFAEQARAAILNKNVEECFNGITRCQNIIMELINGLRPERDPSLCEKLSALYTYMYMRLVKAGTERDASVMDEVLKLLHYERQTWVMLMEQVAAQNAAAEAEPAMAGAMSVTG